MNRHIELSTSIGSLHSYNRGFVRFAEVSAGGSAWDAIGIGAVGEKKS
ncbi:hypothetical protein FWF74_00855 [Candidatus Saccharibacteria bacterium]|nr:hypothetical protein [Candidatus Saccharibacteria bacterium]MCL1963276.1 hypothetical protein [Candidatus Saccharibacteria bacterium]